MDLSLLFYNLILPLLVIIYLGLGVKIFDSLVALGKISKNFSRKCIHIRAGNRVFFRYFIYLQHRSKILRIIPPSFYTAMFLIKLRAPPEDPFVRSMSRSGDPKELLGGTFHFTVLSTLLVLIYVLFPDRRPYALLAAVALGRGDGVAAIFGGYGRIGSRSLSGSLSFIIATIVFGIAYFRFFGIAIDEWLDKIILASIVAAIVEIITPSGYDNITIPLGVLALGFL